MKKVLLIFCTLLFLTESNAQVDFIEVPEVWELDSWNGTEWGLLTQITFTFNSNCSPKTGLGKFKDVGGSDMLENTTFLTITYDGNDLPTESINQLWNDDTNTWEDQLKTTFTFVGTNLIESINYDWLNSNWEASNKSLNTYISDLITENIEQNWDEVNGVWVNISKTEYTYNPNETLNIVTSYDWNSSGNNWVNDVRETYSYSGGLTTSLKTDAWNNSNWENNRLRNYTHDGNGFLIETFKKKWNGSAYENEYRILRTNNNDGFPTEMITQTWFFDAWLNTTRERRTYPDCSSLSTQDLKENAITLYPNPSKDVITIHINKEASFTLSNVNGQILKKGLLTPNGQTININSLVEGLYFLNIKTDSGIVIKKIVKN